MAETTEDETIKWVVTNKAGEELRITIDDVELDSSPYRTSSLNPVAAGRGPAREACRTSG